MAAPPGFSLLAEDASSTDRGVDIIAIHGLGGHACWKPRTGDSSNESGSKSEYWLRDWLPADVPSARIFTYTYDSSLFLDGSGITEASDTLLRGLQKLRLGADRVKKPRRLLFICHSLGGLVVKCALSRAFQNRGEEILGDIVTATQGVIFLGTPHSSSKFELYTSISRIALGNKPNNLTMVATQLMQQIVTQFILLPFHSLPWRIVSFYEELPLPGYDFRAVGSNQEELWTFPQVSLHSHHHDLCRFTSRDDLSYIKVLESLRNITLAPSGKDQLTVHPTLSAAEHEVLKSLEFEDAFTNARDAAQGTCNWILEHEAYMSWKKESSGTLWLTGKPGSGKSTLMKHIIKHDLLEDTTSSTLGAYFFFSRSNENSSVTNLLRSLLYQILKSTPSSLTFEIFASFTERREVLGSDWPWDDDELTESFLRMIDKSTALGGYSFCFVIDALDECDDPDRVISLIQRLNITSNTHRRIRTFFSSRHRPSLTSVSEIRMEDNNSFDILRYIDNELMVWQSPLPSIFSARRPIQTIKEKAGGCFLWAHLVVSILLHEYALEPFEIPQRLALLPTNLEAAYETVLRRVQDSRDGRTARDALTLLLCAQRPLTIDELWAALAVTKGESTQKRQKEVIPQEIASQLPILCGGLIEILPETPMLENGMRVVLGPTVKFIHISVKEFLLREASSAWVIHEDKGGKAGLHFQAALICLSYINETFEHEGFAFSQLPNANEAISLSHFLEYAVLYGMQHLGQAGRMGVRPRADKAWQLPLFQDGFIDRWAYLHNQLFADRNLFKPRKTNAAHVMAYFGLPWLGTGLWGEKLADINEEDHCGQTPLSFAAAMGHIDLCKSLVERGADVNHRDQIYGQTPLNWAAFHGHENVVEFLLQAGSDYHDRKSGVSALWMAARGAHRKVVRLLLEAGANAQTSDERTGESALSQAAALGHIPIVSLLLKWGAEIESRDKHGWTPIHHAVSRGRRKTLELLLGTARQDQLQALRVGPVKAQPSWVDTVLRAILLSICFRKCNQSETPSTGRNNTQDPKAWSGPGQNQNPMTSNRKRGRHKLDQESDEDDYGEDQGAFNKRSRRTNLDGRRFACPYHRRNAVKYHTGACNGKGFENIYRLKSHLKKEHSRVQDLQRCHICQARFSHDEIRDHRPCVKRERATDYEEGFDAVQLGKLMSREMHPGKSSEEKCWYAIFKVLFPDWPENEDMPSPYQDNQNKVILPYRSLIEFCEGLTSSDTINEIMNCIGDGRGEQGIREILERRTGELPGRLGLPPMTGREQTYNAPAADSAVDPQPLSAPYSRSRSTTNALLSAAPLQPPSMSANLGETHFPAMLNNPSGDHQGSGQYLPVLDQSPFQRNIIQDYHSSFNPHSSAMSNSVLDSSSFVEIPNPGSHIYMENVDSLEYCQNGRGQRGSLNSSSSSRAPLSTYVRAGSDPSGTQPTMSLTNNQRLALTYPGPGVSLPQQWLTPMEFGQNVTGQLPEPVLRGRNNNQNNVGAQSQPNGHNHGPQSWL